MIDTLTAICLGGFLVANSADTTTTTLVLNAGGREANPVARRLGLPVVKGAAAGLTTGWALKVSQDHPVLVRVLTVTGAVVFTGLTIHNLEVYRQMQRQAGR